MSSIIILNKPFGKQREILSSKYLKIIVKIARHGPVAQLVRAGDSSKRCVHIERYEMNGMNSGKP